MDLLYLILLAHALPHTTGMAKKLHYLPTDLSLTGFNSHVGLVKAAENFVQ